LTSRQRWRSASAGLYPTLTAKARPQSAYPPLLPSPLNASLAHVRMYLSPCAHMRGCFCVWHSRLSVCLSVWDADSVAPLLALCAAHGIPVAPPYTPSRLFDKMVGHWIEPLCVQPTFLCHHPLAISPLAKQHPTTVRSLLSHIHAHSMAHMHIVRTDAPSVL
jgi:hypothetical protein